MDGIHLARGTLASPLFSGRATLMGLSSIGSFNAFGDDESGSGTTLFDDLFGGGGDAANTADTSGGGGGVDPVVQAYNDCVAKGGGWNNATNTCGPAYAPMPNCWPANVGPQPPGTTKLPSCTPAQVAQIGKDPNGNLVSVGPTTKVNPSACIDINGTINQKCMAAQTGSPGTAKPKPTPTPTPAPSTAGSYTTPLMIAGGLALLGIGYVVVKKRKARRASSHY